RHTRSKCDWSSDVCSSDLVNEIIQFDNFIKKIDELSLTDFENWQELIVWAALFGKAEEVVKYLEEFEPSTWAYLEETYPYVYGRYYGDRKSTRLNSSHVSISYAVFC